MQIFTLLNLTTYLFLTFGTPTTFRFNSQIELTSISNESDFFKYESKDKKVLILKPMKENFDSSMVVLTKNGSYTFNLHVANQKTPLVYEVLEGEKASSYYTVKSNQDFDLLSSDKISLLRVKSAKYKTVNDVAIKTEQYLPKNGKIKLDNEYID
ncbi:hypothetical protein KBB41_03075 [Candidatus Curtissbacteria bacterium]|nr:hypothetical protein [Candidatus Curtissbacteria bacterium]